MTATRIEPTALWQRISRIMGPKRLNVRKDGKGKWEVFNTLTGATVQEYTSMLTLARAYGLINKWETV